jgi:hypothetical protein
MTHMAGVPVDLETVYAREVAYLRKRRKRLGIADTLPNEDDRIAPAPAHGTVGLALSGGGIRSATFSLGVVQALARVDALADVDYLSTVSGGGYLGACITSLLSADPNAGVGPSGTSRPGGEFPLGFSGGDRERPEVEHLRDYSNYIAPHHGPFKLETWRMAAYYVGALVFNLICPLAVAVCAWWMVAPVLAREPSWVWGLAVVAGAVTLGFLGMLFFVASGERWRNLTLSRAARTVAVTALLAVVGGAPFAYEGLVALTFKIHTVPMDRLEQALTDAGLCGDSEAHGCQRLSGSVRQLVDALRWSGAWIGRGPTTARRIARALGAAVRPDATGGDPRKAVFTGVRREEIFRALDRAGIRFGDGSGVGTWFNVLLAALAVLIPPAILGYAKGSLRIGLYTLLGVVSAILAFHLSAWLYTTVQPNLLAAGQWGSIGAVALIVALFFGFAVNVNRVSLLNFYRDRLADCYIIRAERTGDPPIVVNEQLTLHEILPSANGPYHLINATLNLSGSSDLALRGRKAAHFLLSKFYCGSSREGMGYARTDAYWVRTVDQPDLAKAMAISAAAVSPQQGSLTKPGLAFVLSLLNLRLGQWVPNPNPAHRPPARQLIFWNGYFLKELFSLANEDDWYVFLSDGGHFENTAVYALLQRRCATIIAADCGADESRAFEDLAGLIRKARIDFGIDIDLDLTDVHGDPKTHCARRGFAVGTIKYPATATSPAADGCLVYIKPTMSTVPGEDSEDLLQYARSHPAFPQEPTADQFFDEAQFESYRELGYQLTKRAFHRYAGRGNDLCAVVKANSGMIEE